MRILTQLFLFFFCINTYSFADTPFLTISDIHYGSRNNSEDGKDTGADFLANTFVKLRHLSKEVDFILVLGDLPTHALGYSPKKKEYEKAVFHGLYVADSKSKPMFYVSGNNDPIQGNYQPFEFKGKTPLNYAEDWNGACAFCKGLMIDDVHMSTGGYYTSYVIPGNQEIMLVVLNTTQWTRAPFFLFKYPHQDRDANAQLLWLKEQLNHHHAKQLLIAMHVPPGSTYKGKPFWHEEYLKQFIRILEQAQPFYDEMSLLTSHTHMEEFRKIHLGAGKNIYAYSTPSISRIHHNNPAMKTFILDTDFRMKDFITYYTTRTPRWANEHYHAVNTPEAIFPNCNRSGLAHCLNGLSLDDVCHRLEKGLFYRVKSRYVDNTSCRNLYHLINR